VSAELGTVADLIARASALLAEWHAEVTDVESGKTYVAAGHDCIAAIDEARHALYQVRSELADEIRRDEAERIARADATLAELQARREAQAAEVIA
jgi:hypothetical protein